MSEIVGAKPYIEALEEFVKLRAQAVSAAGRASTSRCAQWAVMDGSHKQLDFKKGGGAAVLPSVSGRSVSSRVPGSPIGFYYDCE